MYRLFKWWINIEKLAIYKTPVFCFKLKQGMGVFGVKEENKNIQTTVEIKKLIC